MKNSELVDTTIKVLHDRIVYAARSYSILKDNEQYFDAFIVIGHALETCAKLSYIKDCQDKKEQIKRHDEYYAGSFGNDMIQALELAEDLSDDNVWDAYFQSFQLFKDLDKAIIKPGKDRSKIINQLSNRDGSNDDKTKILNKNYSPPTIQKYIDDFAELICPNNPGWLKTVHLRYCGHKHSNIMQILEFEMMKMHNGSMYIADNIFSRLKEYIDKSRNCDNLIPYAHH